MKHEYLILESSNSFDLANLVVGALDQGWEAQGGVAVSLSYYQANSPTFYQAMVRETP